MKFCLLSEGEKEVNANYASKNAFFFKQGRSHEVEVKFSNFHSLLLVTRIILILPAVL